MAFMTGSAGFWATAKKPEKRTNHSKRNCFTKTSF
jgi:hypothetical protein